MSRFWAAQSSSSEDGSSSDDSSGSDSSVEERKVSTNRWVEFSDSDGELAFILVCFIDDIFLIHFVSD